MTHEIAIPTMTDIQSDMQQVQTDVGRISTLASTLLVNSADSLTIAVSTIAEIASRVKTIKARNDFFTKGIKSHTKAIDNWFKALREPLEQAREILDAKCTTYRMEQQEIARILAESQPQLPTAETQKTVATDSGRVTFTTAWDFEITALDQIEPQILREVVNTARGLEALQSVIRAHIRAGVRTMAGVRIFQTETTRVLGG